jgi:hypothetical protein
MAVFIVAATALGSGRADAAAIHKYHQPEAADQVLGTSWTQFLLGGPNVWATHDHPLYSFKVREEIWNIIKTDPGGEDPVIAFLLWKRSLDPVRFDRFHPRIGPAIEKLKTPTIVQATTSSSPSSPSTPAAPPPPTEGQQLGPPTATPEPSTWLMTIGMAAWAIWQSRRRA